MKLTAKSACYAAHEEGLVLEAYLDSKRVWTWALGVTNASGHTVHPRYKDKPQELERCVEVSLWLMRNKYLPDVEEAFRGVILNEAQIASALSFHWNTGAIERANWVKDYVAGRKADARANIMQWSSKGLLTKRRKREQALFFDGIWPADFNMVPVFQVAKPSYNPVRPHPVNLLPVIETVMAKEGA